MDTIELMRSAHAMPYIEAARAARIAVNDDLSRTLLPLRTLPDGFLPKATLIEFLRTTAECGALRDFGYQAFRRWRSSCLDRDVLARMRQGRTLRERLGTLSAVSAIEDTQLRIRDRREGAATRIILSEGNTATEGSRYGEWIQIAIAVGAVRDAMGLCTEPFELTFQSHYRPSAETRLELGKLRLVTGAPFTSIVIPTPLLDVTIVKPSPDADPAATSRIESLLRELGGGLSCRLKLLLRGYLGEACPTIRLAARLAHTSVRSLQRELARYGVSYSELVQQVRFEQATRMLRDEQTKVIDIALSLGYEDASHFSRAFRRATGMSPRQYRTARDRPADAAAASRAEARAGAEWPEQPNFAGQNAVLYRMRPQEASDARHC